MIRAAQLLLVLAAAGLWGASRLTWVTLDTADGLGQPQTVSVSGSTWAATLVPLALLLLAAAAAVLAVRGVILRVLAALVTVSSAGMAYSAISLWWVADYARYAASEAGVPVVELVGSGREYVGAAITAVAAVITLVAGVLLMRSDANTRAVKYQRHPVPQAGDDMSERMMWDALDEGRDPTKPDTEGR